MINAAEGERLSGSCTGSLTRAGRLAKHTFDFVCALLGIVCLLPLLLVVVLLIKLDTPGAVLFRQKRMGAGGHLFEIFKFRTMVDGAYRMGSRLTVKRDPRVTRLGAILRWSKIDELPQLFNVLRGEMSLIGPRPEDPHFGRFYSAQERRVLDMRPGILGPSQILGRDETEDYPEGLKDTERYYVEHILPQKLARDLDYVRNATFGGDLKLLGQGLWITVRGAFRLKYVWRRRRRLALVGVDLLLCLAAYTAAVVIRFEGHWPQAAYTGQTLLLVALLRPPLLAYFGAYHGMVSYFGLWDMLGLFKAVSVGSIAIAALTYLTGLQGHPRSIFFLDWLLLLLMLGSVRLLLRAWVHRHPRHRKQAKEKVIIVGTGVTGAHLGRVLLEDPGATYEPVGFIAESTESWGARIHGVRVLGGAAELRLALSANGVRTVFTCAADLAEETASEVAEICESAGVDCRMVPALNEILASRRSQETAPAPGNPAQLQLVT